MSKETAVVALNMFGDRLYQKRAQQALPLLVRQAMTQRTIHYEDLAAEMEMPNARNLNYVLGCVGTSIQELSKKWDEAIPPIQCLVTNKKTGLPGEGFDSFFKKSGSTSKLTTREKRRLVNAASTKVFGYTKWYGVLKALNLSPASSKLEEIVAAAAQQQGGGEGKRHRCLKNAIARDPSLVNLPASTKPGEMEFRLPSGDSLDVLFQCPSQWVAVEVKTIEASDLDLVRGIFQCVKYLAVLEAWLGFLGKTCDVRVLLALEGKLPKHLLGLRNSLGVELVESIGERWSFS